MIWKSIFGYPYSISNTGLVRNDRNGNILKGNKNQKGYLLVDLRDSKNGKRKYITIHTLVAFYFIGERPRGFQINHKNSLKRDNRVSNLEYVSPSYNVRHSHISGKAVKKLNNEDVLNLIKDYKAGFGLDFLADKYGIKKRTASDIVRGISWSYLTGIKSQRVSRLATNII